MQRGVSQHVEKENLTLSRRPNEPVTPKITLEPLKAFFKLSTSSRSPATISTPLSLHSLLEALVGSREMPLIFQPSARKTSATEAPWIYVSV